MLYIYTVCLCLLAMSSVSQLSSSCHLKKQCSVQCTTTACLFFSGVFFALEGCQSVLGLGIRRGQFCLLLHVTVFLKIVQLHEMTWQKISLYCCLKCNCSFSHVLPNYGPKCFCIYSSNQIIAWNFLMEFFLSIFRSHV